ncbi:MAG: DUF72 domain-containing protein [Gemmatimonadaceae bacterium]|nr:DUF72 domain-containing protein [Gemmatimonadaceae bacterium]
MSSARRARSRPSPPIRDARKQEILIGCAGWTIPPTNTDRFPSAGSHLERYAAVLPAVEINSSFYRSHRPDTYGRWAATVPADFRFSVKLPKTITHVLKLSGVAHALEVFLLEVASLGPKLGCLLVQLPPSLAFDSTIASDFFGELRLRFTGTVACEPRHASWFDAGADAVLHDARVARVAADPAVVPHAAEPGGWTGAAYYRLHGSPKMYYSAYPEDYLSLLATRLATSSAAGKIAWCMFDNTAGGMAMSDALGLLGQLKVTSSQPVFTSKPARTNLPTSGVSLLAAPAAAPQTHLVQLSLPLKDRSGKALPQRLFQQVRKELTEQFGVVGVCSRISENGSTGEVPSESTRDISVVYEITSEHLDREWWSQYRSNLERRFRHEPIPIKAGLLTFL